MDNENRSCIDCGSAACRGKGGQFPPFCRTEHLDEALLDRSLEILKGEENAFPSPRRSTSVTATARKAASRKRCISRSFSA